jgi:hypothetical protein
MITATVDLDLFKKQMINLTQYSEGFLEGIEKGKTNLLNKIGQYAVESIKEYIDSSARTNPQALHHVYEWYQTGSPDARLFDINYTKNGTDKIFISSKFRQSTSLAKGSSTPFIDKAEVMENGQRLIIKPKKSKVLAFEVDGDEVFTSKPVIINEAGGGDTTNSFEKTFESFFNNYFSQSFMQSSGLAEYLKKPTAYKKNLRAGQRGGRSVGISTGYEWISRAGGDL